MHDSNRPFSFFSFPIRLFSICRLLRYTSRYDFAELGGPIPGKTGDGGFFVVSVHKRRVRCIEELFLLKFGSLVRWSESEVALMVEVAVNALEKWRTTLFRTREAHDLLGFFCVCGLPEPLCCLRAG